VAYDVLRSVPADYAAAAAARGAHVVSGSRWPGSGPARGDLLVRTLASGTGFWEYLDSVNALHYLSGYSYVATTTGDSVGGSNSYTAFLVVGHNASGSMFWVSDPDSGYSVDDLAPAAPASFTGEYAAGATTLRWGPSSEADLAGYRLYRGHEAGFAPGPGNLVAETRATGYVDGAGAPYVYELTAVDVHGNLSAAAVLLPSGTTDVPGGDVAAFALEGVRPNPSRGERLGVTFSLPGAAPARLELLDVSGRRVAVREVGSLGPGRHVVDLAAGRAPAPGLYLVRLTQGANTRVTRVTVLE
jgi:hypothetical protein